MRIYRKIIFLGIVFLSFITMIFSTRVLASGKNITGFEGTKEKKNVLFISSYSPDFITFTDQLKGLIDSLGNEVLLHIEYMDTINVDTKKNEKNFYELIKYKVNQYNKYDVIILGDDEALEFGIKYKDDIFKDISLVFLGVEKINNINNANNIDNIYGIIEKQSVKENVQLITELHKEVKKIVLITDSEDYSRNLVGEFYKSEEGYKNIIFEHIYSIDLSLEEMYSKLRGLTEGTVILLADPNRYKDIEYFPMEYVVDEFSLQSKVPIYATHDYGVGQGFLGGKVVSHYTQGKIAGLIARDIIKGNDIDVKIIDSEELNTYRFDYNELKKNYINNRRLPKDSVIVNKPVLLEEENKNLKSSLVLSFLGLIGIIVTLIILTVSIIIHEKKILKAQKIAEDANEAKNSFISNISHELRTPVAVIMSSNQLLKLKAKNKDFLAMNLYEENAKIVNQNCYRLLRLINNIIDVAKIEAGFYNLKLKNVNIVDLIEKISLSVVPYAESKGLELIFDTTDEEVFMAVDGEKIERIILNLISNAIKFTKKGGTIKIDLILDGDYVKIAIADTGIGIDKGNLDKIFSKFVQIDNTFKRMNEGSGIGLAIVKAFVELHNGEIWVESVITKGSTFTLKLPITLDDKAEYVLEDEAEANAVLRTKIEFSDIYL